jgi:hypothetical protein
MWDSGGGSRRGSITSAVVDIDRCGTHRRVLLDLAAPMLLLTPAAPSCCFWLRGACNIGEAL